MFHFLVLLALLSVVFGNIQLSEFNGRIVNGEDTTIAAHPYQVSLQSSKGHFCGGSIINKNTIVTTAHCAISYNASDMLVRLGSTNYSSGGKLVKVLKVVAHPGFSDSVYSNDVGIVKLAEDVQESQDIRYIKLATVVPKTGTPAVVTGWGTSCFVLCEDYSTTLQQVEVKIISREECASNAYRYGPGRILDTMICAYEVDKDSCQGDSGGPLVANNELVGIISWGEGCGIRGYPGVYTDVPALCSWIVKNSS